jgi:type II secretory pathway pseudopilin PulG
VPTPSRNDHDLKQWTARTRSFAAAGFHFVKTRAGLAILAVLVVAVVAAFVVPSVMHQRQEAADRKIAMAIEAEEARQDAVRELTRGQDRAHALIEDAGVFLDSGLDYADPADVRDLESALDTLKDVAGSNDADAIADARRGVATLISSIGDRPEIYYWTLECTDTAGISHPFEQFRSVWTESATTLGLTGCEAESRRGDFISPDQQQALDTGGVTDASKLGILDSICASLGFSSYASLPTYSSAQVPEMSAAIAHCPDHPRVPDVQARLAASQAEQAALAAGTQFGAGVKRVGTDIQPGTYVSEGNLDGCYWERQDSSGGTIANDFLNAALRVEVTIRSSDYAFNSSDCGTWKKVA